MTGLGKWIELAVFGDGDHEGHEARYFNALAGWAWCDVCGCWEQAEPMREAA